MNTQFFLFIDDGGDCFRGLNRVIALFPLTHMKGNSLWLPYDFILDMAKAYLIVERRNFKHEFADSIACQFQMVNDKEKPIELPLVDEWETYHGQRVSKQYYDNRCFQLKLNNLSEHLASMKRQRYKSSGILCEWHYATDPLLSFFSDPRFQGFLLNAGFIPASSQLQLSLQA